MKYIITIFYFLLTLNFNLRSFDLSNNISLFYANYYFNSLQEGDNRILDIIIKHNYENGYNIEIKSTNNGHLSLDHSQYSHDIPYTVNFQLTNGRVPSNLQTNHISILSDQYFEMLSTVYPDVSTDAFYSLTINFNSMFNNLMSGVYKDKIIIKCKTN